MMKWAGIPTEHDTWLKSRATVKGPVHADFLADFLVVPQHLNMELKDQIKIDLKST